MDFHYALVASLTTPLAEYSMTAEDIRNIVISKLSNNIPNDRYSVSREKGLIIISLNDESSLRFFIVCEPSVQKKVAIMFLKDLQEKWKLKNGSSTSKDKQFENEIKSLLDLYNNKEYVERISKVLDHDEDYYIQGFYEIQGRDPKFREMENNIQEIEDQQKCFIREKKNDKNCLIY